ncbi:MAG: InlB B-repeat-containing protein [Erysipelotrichaceae bacterium]|nr:InlB B-repeat-containing protein [Erysipelotrichaceae bacterium]
MRKILILMLSLLMCLSTFSVFAEDTDVPESAQDTQESTAGEEMQEPAEETTTTDPSEGAEILIEAEETPPAEEREILLEETEAPETSEEPAEGTEIVKEEAVPEVKTETAEETTETEIPPETSLPVSIDYEELLSHDYGEILQRIASFSEAERNVFYEEMPFSVKLELILRSKAYSAEMTEDTAPQFTYVNGPQRPMLKAAKIGDLSGFQSGAFEEGKNVSSDARKYIYGGDRLLWSGKVNEQTERFPIEGDTFTLWAPEWGTYLGEKVGAEIIIKRLANDNGWNFQFYSAGKPFYLYTENAKQEMITVRFYRNVDTSKAKANGERLKLQTKFKYLLFGAMGLTNETFQSSSIEYTAPYNEDLPVYSPMDRSEIETSNEYGHTVYYSNKPHYNSSFVFNVKDLDEIKLLVGHTGSDNWKDGGDGTILFTIGFNAYDMIKQGHLLQIDPNGGKYSGSLTEEGVEGQTLNIPDPTRSGYTFTGWKVNGGSMKEKTYTFADSDGKITAQWAPQKYKITYVLNGGKNHADNPSEYTVNDALTLKDPSKEGHRFLGWKEGKTIPKGSTGDKTFTAQWESEIYPIEYILNGGKNDPTNPTQYRPTEEIVLKDPARAHYVFKGWKEGKTIPKGSTGKKTFTAQWEAEKYPIEYILGGGNNHPQNPESYTVEDDLSILPAERKGYLFKGWKEGDHIMKGSSGKKAFTAVWEAEVYPITYELKGGKNDPKNPSQYTIEEEITILDAVKEHYLFKGWEEGKKIPKGSSGKKTFTAVWEAEKYPIEYILEGGSNHPQNPASYTCEDEVVIKEAQRKGYSFRGWKEGDRIPKGSSGKKTFTAQWEAEVYPITYELKGGRNNPHNPAEYTIEDEITILDAEKRGYLFEGWEEGDHIAKGSTGARQFTASWKAEIYPINYVLEGGSNHPQNPVSYTVEDEIKIKDPERSGYTFIGWKEGNEIPLGSTGAKTFTAQWKEIIYDITYDLQDSEAFPADNSGNPAHYTIKDHVLLKDPVRTGYLFKGWAEGKEIPAGSTGDRRFTAQWEAIRYPIVYDTDGGENDPKNPHSYTVEEDIEILDPHRGGLIVFHGWIKEGKIIKGWKRGEMTGKVTLTASWISTCRYEDKNCDGVVSCEEQHGSGWYWDNAQKACAFRYRVVDTAAGWQA